MRLDSPSKYPWGRIPLQTCDDLRQLHGYVDERWALLRKTNIVWPQSHGQRDIEKLRQDYATEVKERENAKRKKACVFSLARCMPEQEMACVYIPVQNSSEEVRVDLDLLPRDAVDILDILRAEQAPLNLWLVFAVSSLSLSYKWQRSISNLNIFEGKVVEDNSFQKLQKPTSVFLISLQKI